MISTALVAFLLVFVADVRSQQECSYQSDNELGYKASWVYDAQNKRVQFTIEAKQRLSDNFWTGIGFGRTMKNGDMIIITNTGGRLSVSDRHGTGYTEPALDSQQDVQNFVGRLENGVVYATFIRNVNTNDPNDKPLEDPTLNNCQYFMFPSSGGSTSGDATKLILEQHISTPTTKLICNISRCVGTASPTSPSEGQPPTTPGAGPAISNNIQAEELARDSPPGNRSRVSPGAGSRPTTPAVGAGQPDGGSPGVTPNAPGAKVPSASGGAPTPAAAGAGGADSSESACEYSEGQYKVQWYYTESTKRITFSLNAPLPTSRWTGIGFGQQMQGGDMILVYEQAGALKVSDRHGTGHVEPAVDAHQDVENFKGAITAGVLHATFNRQLNTGDKDDLPIDDPAQNNCQYFIFPVSGGIINEVGKLQIHDSTPNVKLICNAKLCKKPSDAAPAGGADGGQGAATPTDNTDTGAPSGTGAAGTAPSGNPPTGTGAGKPTSRPNSPANAGQPQPGQPQPGQPQPGQPQPGQPQPGNATSGLNPNVGAVPPGSGQPAGNQPAGGQGVGGQSNTSPPPSGLPTSGQPAGGQPIGNQPVNGQPSGGQPIGGQPTPIGGAPSNPGGAGATSPQGATGAGGQNGGEPAGAGGVPSGGQTAPIAPQGGVDNPSGAQGRQCPARQDHSACRTYIDDYLSVVYSRFPKTDVITQKACTLLATHQEGVVLRECCHYLSGQCGRFIDQYIGGISSNSASGAGTPFAATSVNPAGAGGTAPRAGPISTPPAGGDSQTPSPIGGQQPSTPNANAGQPNPAANPNAGGLTPTSRNQRPNSAGAGDLTKTDRGPEIQPAAPAGPHAGSNPVPGSDSPQGASVPSGASSDVKSGGSSAGKRPSSADPSQPDAGGKPGPRSS